MFLPFTLALLLSVPAAPAADAESTTRAFYRLYAGGDVDAAAAMWRKEERAAFVEQHARPMRVSCRALAIRSVKVTSLSEDAARVEVSGEESKWSNGRKPITAAHHAVVELRRASEQRWEIVDWRRSEYHLAARWLELKTSSERSALLHSVPALRTPALAEELSGRAVELMNRDRYEDALALLDTAQQIADEVSSDSARSLVLGARSIYHKRTSADPSEALRLAEEALVFAERADDVNLIARASLRLSKIDAGDPRRAAERVLDTADEIEDMAWAAMAAARLVGLESRDGDYLAAFRHALLGRRYAEMGGGPGATTNALMTLAAAYRSQGGHELAIPHFEAALAIARAERAPAVETGLLSQLAATHLELGHVDEFFRIAEQAIAVPLYDSCAAALGTLSERTVEYIRMGDLARAEVDLRELKKRATGCGPHRITALLAEANLRMAQKRPTEARAIAEEAMRIELRPDAVILLAKTLRAEGRAQEARAKLEEVVAGFELQREAVVDPLLRHNFFRARAGAYRELVDLLVDMKDPREALIAAERLKARVLRDLHETRDETDRELMTMDERRHMRRLEERIAALNKSILAGDGGIEQNAREGELLRARVELRELEAGVLAMRARSEPLPRRDDVTLLVAPPADATVLEYVVGEKRTIAFTINRGASGEPHVTQTIIPIGKRELRRRVDACLLRISQRSAGYASEARALYELLIEPLESRLRGRMLYIIGDDVLWRLPFHALRSAGGKHLIESRNVAYAPSYALLEERSARRERHAAPTILAFGNPRVGTSATSAARAWYRDAELGDLPEAEDEVRELSRLYGSRARVYVRSNASEEALKRDSHGFDILHFATHGLVDHRAPLFSALVLAGSESEDGLLEAREIARLSLDADLAILSACDTANGELAAGEGIVGLSWAVMAAGCPRTIGAQWRVSSAATKRLMVAFHRRLAKRVVVGGIAEDLREAQLEMLRSKEYSHPYYWAPFMLIGRD